MLNQAEIAVRYTQCQRMVFSERSLDDSNGLDPEDPPAKLAIDFQGVCFGATVRRGSSVFHKESQRLLCSRVGGGKSEYNLKNAVCNKFYA